MLLCLTLCSVVCLLIAVIVNSVVIVLIFLFGWFVVRRVFVFSVCSDIGSC